MSPLVTSGQLPLQRISRSSGHRSPDPLTPGYGETPLPHDELAALLPEVVEVLDKPITRADVYDLEQGLQDQVFDLLMPTAVEGSLSLDELLSDHFVRDLHARMFGPV